MDAIRALQRDIIALLKHKKVIGKILLHLMPEQNCTIRCCFVIYTNDIQKLLFSGIFDKILHMQRIRTDGKDRNVYGRIRAHISSICESRNDAEHVNRTQSSAEYK